MRAILPHHQAGMHRGQWTQRLPWPHCLVRLTLKGQRHELWQLLVPTAALWEMNQSKLPHASLDLSCGSSVTGAFQQSCGRTEQASLRLALTDCDHHYGASADSASQDARERSDCSSYGPAPSLDGR